MPTTNSGNGLGHPRVDKETNPVVSNGDQIGSDEERLLVKEDRKRDWKEYSTLEKSLWISLLIVSAIAIAFIIGVAVLGLKLNEEDKVPVTKIPTTTLLPPWLTFAPPTPSTTTKGPPTPKPPGWNICSDEECILTGAKIMESMDKSVSPCEDFWSYSCGGWNNNNKIPDGYSQWDQFNVIGDQLTGQIRDILESDPKVDPLPLTQAKQFYGSCKKLEENKNDYTQLTTLVDSMVTSDPVTLTHLGTIRRRLGENYMWTLYVDLDEMNTQNNTIYLDQPTFGIPQSYLMDFGEDDDFVKAYTLLIQGIWTAVYPDDDNLIPKIAKDIVQFEASLAQITTDPEDRRNKTKLYNPMLIGDLPGDDGKLEWKKYFEQVFYDMPEFADGFEWDKTTVIVRDLSFLSQIGPIFNDPTQQAIIRNYLKWRIIFTLANDVSSELRELVFKFSSLTQGLLAPPSIWKYCAQKTNSIGFGFAVSYQYLQLGFFTVEQRNEINAIVENVREAFVIRLNSTEIDWIVDDTTMTAADLKAKEIKANIGFPDWLATSANSSDSYTILDYYKDLELSNSKNHFQNVLNVLEWTSLKQLKEINQTKDTKRWPIIPTTINSFYTATGNSLTLPAAIIKSPFHGMPLQYLNYGAIGSLLAHEFVHAFDATDRQNNEKGDLLNWFDEETEMNYINKTQCFVEQYDNYTVQNGPSVITLNGEMTLDANIAEIGGLNLAFKAYQLYMEGQDAAEKLIKGLDTLNVQQMFFLSYAQSFCGSYAPSSLEMQVKTGKYPPHQFRVRGALENSQIFAKTWKCPVKPVEELCQLW